MVKARTALGIPVGLGLATLVIAGVLFSLGSAPGEAASERLTNAEVDAIVAAAVTQANIEESGLRVDAAGDPRPTKMHIAVVDRDGKLRVLRSMPDAWIGSIAIAKAKAYTAAAFSSDENALTSRSIGLLSQPGGPLWHIGNSNEPNTGMGSVTPQGLIEFPGGLPLYKNGKLVGGIGVSGDGVDQDEDVAEAGACGFQPPSVIRVDTVSSGAVAYTAAASFTCP